jgi:predicted dehydrogenase/threonine dehydrogenase-like Zn-dependent dehydrogenase
MKQVLFRGGETVIEEVPAPRAETGQILVRVAWSCVSPGTELTMAAGTSVGNVVNRFRSNPIALRRALDTLRGGGLRGFATMARDKLTSSTAVGYSCSGVVLEAGSGAEEFKRGDRVACAGAGYANHAEVAVVPRNLATIIPEGVCLEEAATVALGAIALQGVRRARVSLGERVGVIGLGFLGQLTVQILKASGCKVFGLDLEPARVAQAKSFGLDAAPAEDTDVLSAAKRFSEGYGLDAVLLTAATKSDEPLSIAMQMARRKGRIVVIGDVGLAARRDAMYAKELDLLIATSYGPGRYDPTYEEEGIDYPYAYVRWTENRNMQAYLELIAAGRVTPAPLIARRLPVTEAGEAYRSLKEEKPRPYTVLLEYPTTAEPPIARHVTVTMPSPAKSGIIRLGMLGAGSFTRGMHFPNLRKLADRFRIEAIVTRHGPAALTMARQVGARTAATDYNEVLTDPMVDAVLIATRHHLHAKMIEEALRAGKHVFVEKPLAITEEELENLDSVVRELERSSSGCPVVFVGFNRRYSPYAVRLREVIAQRSTPINLSYRMNAGYLPPEHWTQGPEGGGRALGEACHILDLFRSVTGSCAVDVSATGIRSPRRDVAPTDNFTATIRYDDGSACTLLYTAQGGKELSKEALEMHVDGCSFLLDDYRSLTGFGVAVQMRTRTQEKGHYEELIAFYETMSGAQDRRRLWNEALEVTRTALEVDRQVRRR